MRLSKIKTRILESPVGYSIWSGPLNRPKIAAIERMLMKRTSKESSVLDVGCGPGSNAEIFRGWDYVGVDLNESYIEKARAKFPDMTFEVADATNLKSDRQLSLVLVNSLMHHLNDEQCISLLNGTARLLAANGSLIVQEPIRPRDNQRLQKFLMDQDRGEYFRSQDEWLAIFDKSGLLIAADDRYEMKLANLIVGWQMYSVLLTK